MKIISLKAENIKRLKAIEIKPDGSLVVVGGRNGQGKSSTLDSIWMALGGKDACPSKPVREGEASGTIELELDSDIVVRRKFNAKTDKTTLEVTTKAGAAYPSPQAVLDALCSKLCFDPLKFSSLPEKTQSETLRQLVGIDFTEMDAQREQLYAERTVIGRRLKELEGKAAGRVYDATLPEQEVQMADILQRLDAAQVINQARAKLLETHNGLDQRVVQIVDRQKMLASQISDLQTRIQVIKDEMATNQATREAIEEQREGVAAKIAQTPEINCDSFHAQLKGIEQQNAAIRANRATREIDTAVTAEREKYQSATKAIEQIDFDKQKQLAEAKFPIAGLSFDATGISFNGIPFGQLSSAEQLRISVGIGLALNPKLRVLLIRDGSLLDADNLQLIAEMAIANDAQIWMERVSSGDEVSVVIEDGMIETITDNH